MITAKKHLLWIMVFGLFYIYCGAQEKINYHVGIASSLIWYDDGIRDIFNATPFAIPVGANLPIGKKLLYDVQFTPIIDCGDMANFVLLHGLFYDIGNDFWVDIRSTVEFMDRKAYGFNVGINKLLFFPLDKAKKRNLFVVLAAFLPFRFGGKVEGGDLLIPTFGAQLGFGF